MGEPLVYEEFMNAFDIVKSSIFEDDDPFSTAYDDPLLDLDKKLEDSFKLSCQKLGSNTTLEHEVAISKRDEPYYYIQSVVGDDENTTTDLPMLGYCLLNFAQVISGVRTSWKDCGVSKIISNYAEGWILTPPNREASFEAVAKRHRSEGVPFVLDTVKLKNLSPVRKQSQLWDMDLESKLTSIAKVASWADKSWFTYDYHQMALILATAIFDFEDSVKFPYLFHDEGGCGGDPPYGNLNTAYSGLHFFNRGKSKIGILGIMTESYLVNTGKVKPSDTFFIKAAHISQMGSTEWIKYESAYRTLQKTGELSRLEVNDILKVDSGTQLPEEILQYGTVVKPLSFIEGHSIAILREKGYIMTELDVKVTLSAQERERAIYGSEPYRIYLEQQELEMKIFKSKFMKIMSDIVQASPLIKKHLRDRIGEIPTTYGEELNTILTQYYTLRAETYTRFSSFRYTDEIRIFKKHEIMRHFQDRRGDLHRDMFGSDQLERRPILEETKSVSLLNQEIDSWFDSAPLSELLSKPVPTGLGIDDYRVVVNTVSVLQHEDFEESNHTCFLIILFSADQDLARILMKIIGSITALRVITAVITPTQYINLCVGNLNGYKKTFNPSNLSFYNYLTERLENFSVSALDQLVESSGLDPEYFKRAKVHLEYDFPNIERHLESITLNVRTQTLSRRSGGFLQRSTLQDYASTNFSWASLSYNTLKEISDFHPNDERARVQNFKTFRISRDLITNPMNPIPERERRWSVKTFTELKDL